MCDLGGGSQGVQSSAGTPGGTLSWLPASHTPPPGSRPDWRLQHVPRSPSLQEFCLMVVVGSPPNEYIATCAAHMYTYMYVPICTHKYPHVPMYVSHVPMHVSISTTSLVLSLHAYTQETTHKTSSLGTRTHKATHRTYLA